MRTGLLRISALIVSVAAFLLLAGLGPERLPFPPGNRYSDAVTSHWPNALLLRRAILDDHALPLWNRLIFSGQPFAANPLSKVWYPPQWLVLLLPPIAHLNLLIALHMIGAGVGAWRWSRATGLSAGGAAIAAGSTTFAPRLIAALGAGHLDLLYAAAWVPWLFAAIHALASPGAHRRSAVAAGVFGALAILADIRLGAYALAVAAVYLLWRAWETGGYRTPGALAARAVLFALIAAGLSAIQWVPLLLYRPLLSRGDLSLQEAAFSSLAPAQWIGLAIGDHGGNWETLVYTGISALVLALAALLKRPRQFVFWWGVIGFAGLYAMGDHTPLWTALNRLIPALRWWRVPPRIWLIAALVVPHLAGWGAHLLAAEPSPRRAARQIAVGLLGGGLACGFFSTLVLSAQIDWTAAVGIFALPAVALVIVLALTGRLAPRALLIAFAVIVLADVLWIDRTLVTGRSRHEWLEPYRPLAETLIADGALRVYSPSYSLPQQAAAYWDIAQFGGVDPFQMRAYVATAMMATGVRTTGYSITLPAYEAPAGQDDLPFEEVLVRANRAAPIRPDLLGEWLVTHVISAYPLDAAGLELIAEIAGVYVYHNSYAPDVTLAWDGPNRVTAIAGPRTSGTVYAVAAGRWQQSRAEPGLPGTWPEQSATLRLTYSASEVFYGLGAGALLIALASLIGWRSARA